MRWSAHDAGARSGLKLRRLLGRLTRQAALAFVSAAAAVALAATAAGCGGSHRSTAASTASSGGAAPSSSAAASSSPTAAASPSRQAPATPALNHLRRVLRRLFARAGRSSAGDVYDLNAGLTLFALRSQQMHPPASLQKLYTSVALVTKLGSNARFETAVLGVGRRGSRGVWHGNLYLRGGGDPTFGDGYFNKLFEQGYGPTAAQLAEQLRRRGIRRVTGRLIGDASLFDGRPGGPSSAFGPDIPDFGGELSALTFDHGATSGTLTPGAFAARQLARTLRSQHVRVRAAPLTGLTPPRGRLMAIVRSPPVSVLLKLMDVPSDDLFAEVLTKQLGVRFGGGGSTARGARVIANVLAGYGLKPTIVDGSGLSRNDRSSPAQVVALLRRLWRTEIGSVLLDSLPVVGISGTAASLPDAKPARRRCIAKTGTLDGVTNLAGYCAARGRRELAFALFVDGPPNAIGMVLLGRMVAAIARY